MATPLCAAFFVAVSAAMAASRASGSSMSLWKDTRMPLIWLPPEATWSGVRVDTGTVVTSDSVGGSPTSVRYDVIAPATTLRQASLMLAPATWFLICFMSASEHRASSHVRWAETG